MRRSHKTAQVQTLTRGLAILEALYASPDGLSLHELSGRVGCPKPSLLRLLDTLVERSYLCQDARTGRYSLDPLQMLRASNLYRPAGGRCVAIHRLLEDLSQRTRETAVLAVIDPRSGLAAAVDYVETRQVVRAVPPIFQPLPALCMSMGRAWLARLSDADAAETARRWEAATEATPEDMAQALADLARVRDTGYAITVDGVGDGHAAVSAAVTDAEQQPFGGAVVLAPVYRMTSQRFHEIGQAVCATANMLSNVFARDFVGPSSPGQREMVGAGRGE